MQRDIYQESQTTEFYWIEGKFLSQNIPAAYQISLIKKKKIPWLSKSISGTEK